MIHHAAPARVGILGNPSDGSGGRTLALAVPRFEATVFLEPADGVEIVGRPDDQPRWSSVAAMVDHLDRLGYGTGPQLLAATVRTFLSVAESVGCPVGPGFRLSYTTNIPRRAGLGGSSALVVAALRCLNEYHQLDMPLAVLPSVALRVETAQLGLAAGLQDRVVQTYGGLVAMDFTELDVDARFGVSHGSYDQLDPAALPPLFVAYREATAPPGSEQLLRVPARHEHGDGLVREALRELAALVTEGRAALRWGDQGRLGALLERNLVLCRALGPVPEAQLELIEVAEATGAAVTLAGAGGAVVGTFRDADHFETLSDLYADIGADVVRVDTPAAAGPVVEGGADEGAERVRSLPTGPGPAGDRDGITDADDDTDDDPPVNNVLTLERHDH